VKDQDEPDLPFLVSKNKKIKSAIKALFYHKKRENPSVLCTISAPFCSGLSENGKPLQSERMSAPSITCRERIYNKMLPS
jgi:hypothetical protein